MARIRSMVSTSLVSHAAALIVAVPVSCAVGQNLVFNPGFETEGGSPTSADFWEVFALGGLAERQTVMPHTGDASILLEGDPVLGANFAVIVQRDIPVVPGTDYELSFFAKAPDVDGQVGYRLEFYRDTGRLIGGMFDLNVIIDGELTADYQEFCSTFTPPEEAATGTIVLFWELLNGLTSVNFDDVYFGEAVTSCLCEFGGDSSFINIEDLLGYLALWLVSDAGAEVDGTPGVNIADLLEFLACWFDATANNGACS